jgi:hypothetical protein
MTQRTLYHIISKPTLCSTVPSLIHSSHCHPSRRLILFYSPSDNDTKSFKEKYIKLAASLRASGIKTGAVNCEKETDLCDQHSAHHLTGEAREVLVMLYRPKLLPMVCNMWLLFFALLVNSHSFYITISTIYFIYCLSLILFPSPCQQRGKEVHRPSFISFPQRAAHSMKVSHSFKLDFIG